MLKCNKCGHEFEDDHVTTCSCPKCDSIDIRIKSHPLIYKGNLILIKSNT